MIRKLKNDPVIVKYLRTPLGRYGGLLCSIRPDDMVSALLKNITKNLNLDPELIDEVIIGCANQAGEDNRNIARMAVLLAGLPDCIPAITINRLCASGLDAIIAGARRIITGEHDCILAGGVESMSRAPYVLQKPASNFLLKAPEIYDSSLGWRFFNPRMLDRTPPESNGVTAERLAQKYAISREKQDLFALNSHQKAVAAQEQKIFNHEIMPIEVKKNKKEKILLTQDEGPRKDSSLDKLQKLRPAFLESGSVTAGNSSSLNDGAAILAVCSHEFASRHNLKPLARILGFSSAGVDPKIMGIGPVNATKKLLSQTNLKIQDFSSIEINEAFAAQVLAVMHDLDLEQEKINPYGGAIALGHPLGCSGARIVCTLINFLTTNKKHLGLATLCVGVGQGVSMAVEAIGAE